MMTLLVMMLLSGGGLLAYRLGQKPTGLRPRSAQVPTRRCRGNAGQTSAEYALVLLGVGAVALLVLGWATKTGKVGDLLDAVYDSLIGSVV
jgi:hypothetical protein